MGKALPVAAMLLLALFGWAGINSIAGPSSSEAAMLQSIERLAEGQAQVLARLERLERYGAGRHTVRPLEGGQLPKNRLLASGLRAGQDNVPGAPQEPDHGIRAQESRFVAETLAPAWGTRNEARINAFLDKPNLERMKTTVPSQVSARCHSQTCRISMVFKVDDFPDATLLNLLQSIADELPGAATFHVPRPDGSVEVLVFAHGPAANTDQ